MLEVDKGMDKKIKYIMGTPSIKDTFNYSTWDYFLATDLDEYTEAEELHHLASKLMAFISGNIQPSNTDSYKKFKGVKEVSIAAGNTNN